MQKKLRKMSSFMKTKISEEFKTEVKEHFNDVSCCLSKCAMFLMIIKVDKLKHVKKEENIQSAQHSHPEVLMFCPSLLHFG